MNAAAYTSKGASRDSVELPAELFDGTINMPVMHQAVKAYLANQRQGNAATKTRGFVIGGNQKPWKQKGTGRARQGSIRAPQWVGGGTVFGPTPRSYAQYVPRKVRALARKSAFNARARENAVIVIDAFDYDAPKTSQLLALLGVLGVADKKVLILTDGVNHNVYMSGRNLPRTHVMPYSDVSTYHLLWSDVVVIEASALGAAVNEQETGETGEDVEGERPARKASVKKAVKASAAKKTGRKTVAKKTVAKKSAAKKSAMKKGATKKSTAKKSAAKKTKRSAPKKGKK
ncbi:MAG: 50S ribosomal protein L4 [Gemmatimonadaceae bacterium]|nr:50S ribosomal protein L4 [Gemmatimonadaceae bacterium]